MQWKGNGRLLGIRAGGNVAQLIRKHWISVIADIAGGILFAALSLYASYYIYSWFYGSDSGYGEQYSGSNLVQSNDVLWKDFAKCKISMDQNLSSKTTYTPRVSAMDGKNVTISGFMQPLEAKDKFSHFLLSKNAPTCAYCPPGGSNEVIEVFSSKPMAWKENLISITGTLVLVNDSKQGVLFQMKDAVER
jgi:hypothetical protein